jgi:hypothetical protein
VTDFFNIDISQLEKTLKDFPVTDNQIIKRAFKDALNKVAAFLRKEALQKINNETDLKLQILRRRILSFYKNSGDLSAIKLFFGWKPFNLGYLKPKQDAEGLSVGDIRVKSAFLIKKMKNLAYIRELRGPGGKRYPIAPVNYEFDKKVFDITEEIGFLNWQKIFQAEFERSLRWRSEKRFLSGA